MAARRVANCGTHRTILATARGFNSRGRVHYPTANAGMQREYERQKCDKPLHNDQTNSILNCSQHQLLSMPFAALCLRICSFSKHAD
jgi:hypothetical protein